MIPWIEMNNAVNRKLLESNFYRNLFPNCQLATIISPLFFFLLYIYIYIYIYKPVNTKKKFYRILYAKEKRKRNLLDHMDSNQMRPVTPQPPQGGGSGFPAILSLLILHRHLRHGIIYQTISTLNTIYKYSTATALFITAPSPVINPSHSLSLIDFNSVCFSIWSLTLSVSSYSRLDF